MRLVNRLGRQPDLVINGDRLCRGPTDARAWDNPQHVVPSRSPAVATDEGLRPLRLRPKALALLTRLAVTSEPQDRGVLASGPAWTGESVADQFGASDVGEP
jgi:hypothetical protein